MSEETAMEAQERLGRALEDLGQEAWRIGSAYDRALTGEFVELDEEYRAAKSKAMREIRAIFEPPASPSGAPGDPPLPASVSTHISATGRVTDLREPAEVPSGAPDPLKPRRQRGGQGYDPGGDGVNFP